MSKNCYLDLFTGRSRLLQILEYEDENNPDKHIAPDIWDGLERIKDGQTIHMQRIVP